MKNRTQLYLRIGSISYILWGALNILAGALLLGYAIEGNLKDYLYNVAPLVDSNQHVTLSTNQAVIGLAGFHAFNYLWIGLVSIVIAVKLNWNNSIIGFWINGAFGLFINLGFLFFQFLPGTMPFANGSLVLLLFLVGAIFTGIPLTENKRMATSI